MTRSERQALEAELPPSERDRRERRRVVHREYMREYRRANAEAAQAYSREYYHAHAEARRAYNGEYRLANRARLNANQREYRHNNAESVHAYNRQYKRDNIEQTRAHWRKNAPIRRAREQGVYTESLDPIEIFRRDKWKCRLCGTKTPQELRGTSEPNAPTIDHVIPLKLGGPHTKKNLQCLCRECNQTKATKYEGQLAFA